MNSSKDLKTKERVREIRSKAIPLTSVAKAPPTPTDSPRQFRHPYDRDALWVDLYCGKKPCSECPRYEHCEEEDW